MGYDNIIQGDGFGLALTGMLIVFIGLILISLYIAALPRVFARVEAVRRRYRAGRAPAAASAPSARADDPALRAALAVVIRMELENDLVEDAQRITIQRDEAEGAWAFAGKMRSLSSRM
jgi:Na+-transporting methylmalonyl-CoA/oxaloacetate decarboxylase gamma subunit